LGFAKGENMRKHLIFGVHITNRVKHVPEVQKVLTEFGCSIKTRLGLHEASSTACSPNGLILLEMVGNDKASNRMAQKLKAIEGIEVQKMLFAHP
jgi:hypothetical protein